jgi:hypothetical protein
LAKVFFLPLYLRVYLMFLLKGIFYGEAFFEDIENIENWFLWKYHFTNFMAIYELLYLYFLSHQDFPFIHEYN